MPGKFDIHVLFNHWDRFAEGFIHTIEASVLALIGSFVLGVIIAVMRISPVRALNVIGTVYVEFIRNIPLLLVVFFFFLGLPSLGLPLDGFTSGTLGLTVYTASFIAEAIRAGIQSVPTGQTEAARATGLSYIQTMLHIVLPQAIKIVLPAIGNQFINLVKNSSILAVVTGLDLMYYADLINSDTFLPLTVYTIVAVFYLVLTLPLSFAVHYMERRFRSADR
ncbi:putative glutamine transport system permease protein [Paenibacillus rhizosphaerae]|uniref:Putative glutamine transport system permease protein n=1 Tax=Paenibacillus rhizosphaerae TaxID=297318 RepID=A0A839TXT0_9BACL|nr:amino acid ABC transporter permease [Paenibacillus rhizosphaerae]MBB3130069.1 putative glutamine transport system permease protein [Paenibacillus rhizosphaerae]